MTKEQALKMSTALDAIRKKTGYDPSKGYKWSICLNFMNHKEFMIMKEMYGVTD